MPKVLKMRELGDPILRKVAKAVSSKEINSKEFHGFVKSLIKTCEAKDGVGLAATQVIDKKWEQKKVFIIWSRPSKRYKKAPKMEPMLVINPKIISKSEKMKKDFEGCLSIPGIRGLVPRHVSIETEFRTIDGKVTSKKFSNFLARIFQHEFDHLEGIVFLDRTNLRDLLTEKEYKKKNNMSPVRSRGHGSKMENVK